MDFNFNDTALKGRSAAFVAAPHQIETYGIGVRIKPADFGSKDVPAGTIVSVKTVAGIEYAVPYKAGSPAYLTFNDVIFSVPTGTSDSVQLLSGGPVYANRLAQDLTDAMKADLGGRFTFLNANF